EDMLTVENLYKKYDGKQTFALENINLTIPNNGFVSIVGKSGSGKTTFLNLVGGLDQPTEGNITLDNINITKLSNKELEEYRNKYVSFIYQDFNLMDYLSVEENISILGSCEENIIKKLGLEELKNKSVNKLSGGEKQRVCIARALTKKPKIILADEPTGALDPGNSEKIMEILKEISKSILVIVITHNESLAQKYSDEIITLESAKIINKEQKVKNVDIKDEKNYQLLSINKKIEKRIFQCMMFSKPLKFILSLIMLVLMFSILIISDSINEINVPVTMANSVIKEEDKVLYMENKYGTKSNHDKFVGKKYFGEINSNNHINEKNAIALYADYDAYIKWLE
ncbi:MAG: ABC transporter ATP-binding protein, partial [Bacilli bacterium]|nr:ABC transporter ATP-binding protein [Bacilli bacterium]